MWLFRPTPPPKPLEYAINLVHQATEIAYRYKRDKRFMPDDADIALFERLSQALWENRTIVEYLGRCMHQRRNGQPEGSEKWRDPEIFDYHYPP